MTPTPEIEFVHLGTNDLRPMRIGPRARLTRKRLRKRARQWERAQPERIREDVERVRENMSQLVRLMRDSGARLVVGSLRFPFATEAKRAELNRWMESGADGLLVNPPPQDHPEK